MQSTCFKVESTIKYAESDFCTVSKYYALAQLEQCLMLKMCFRLPVEKTRIM